MRNYNRDGVPQMSADFGNDLGAVSNKIRRATNRNIQFYLNGADQLSFSLNLKDPMALIVKPLTSFVKVWRSVPGYADPANAPCFSGIVTSRVLRGNAGQVDYTVFSPIWRLQSRFHILNHYLNINVDTGQLFTHSELMFKFIDLVNEAF